MHVSILFLNYEVEFSAIYVQVCKQKIITVKAVSVSPVLCALMLLPTQSLKLPAETDQCT